MVCSVCRSPKELSDLTETVEGGVDCDNMRALLSVLRFTVRRSTKEMLEIEITVFFFFLLCFVSLFLFCLFILLVCFLKIFLCT